MPLKVSMCVVVSHYVRFYPPLLRPNEAGLNTGSRKSSILSQDSAYFFVLRCANMLHSVTSGLLSVI